MEVIITHPTLQEVAYGLIKNQILSGEVLPGERISLEKCAAELGVSPTPVREALAKLQQEGLTQYFPRSGWRVPKLSRKNFLEQRELQVILETALAERALPGMTHGVIKNIKESNERMKDAIKTMPKEELGRYLQEENDNFHMLLFSTYDNHAIKKVLQNTWDTIRYQRTIMCATDHFLKICCPDHERIIRALETKDLDELRDAMDAHFQNGPICLEECFENISG